jgi:hypothetical protein
MRVGSRGSTVFRKATHCATVTSSSPMPYGLPTEPTLRQPGGTFGATEHDG